MNWFSSPHSKVNAVFMQLNLQWCESCPMSHLCMLISPFPYSTCVAGPPAIHNTLRAYICHVYLNLNSSVRSKIYILHSWKKQCLPWCTHTRPQCAPVSREIKLGQNSITSAHMHAPQLPHQRIFRSTFGAKDPAAPRVNVVNVFHSVAMARRAFPTRPASPVAFNDHQLQKWRASELLRCLCPGGAQFRSPLHTMCNWVDARFMSPIIWFARAFTLEDKNKTHQPDEAEKNAAIWKNSAAAARQVVQVAYATA